MPSEFAELPEDYFVQDVELISRVFSYYDDDWHGELEQILHVLHELFNTTESTFPFRLLVNETCGLHVHVGAGKGQNHRFPLSTLSKLFQIVTGFERLLSEMHPTSRLHEPACKTPSQFFRRRRASPTARRRSGSASHPLAWCDLIAQAALHAGGLDALMGAEDGHGHAYNFDNNIVGGAAQVVPRKQTVEFRQHRGTLELLEIVAWCEVVTALVAFCGRATTADVRALLGGRVEDADYLLDDLLRDVGVQDDVREYYFWRLGGKGGADEQLDAGRVRATGPMGRVVESVEKNRWRDGNEAIVGKWIKTYYEAGGFGRFGREASGSLDRKYLEGRVVFRRVRLGRW